MSSFRINSKSWLLLISLSALVFSLTSGVAIGAPGAEELLDQEKLKVGVILPLTGPLAEYGMAARNGIELARKEYPELFHDL